MANELDPQQGEIPMSLRDKMAEMRYFGFIVPEEYESVVQLLPP